MTKNLKPGNQEDLEGDLEGDSEADSEDLDLEDLDLEDPHLDLEDLVVGSHCY